jgi:hypothetical protein
MSEDSLGGCYTVDGHYIPKPDEGLDACPGGIGQESCTVGYAGLRCSQCKRNPAGPCSDAESNIYYRVNAHCEPCPCSPMSLTTLQRYAVIHVMYALQLYRVDYSASRTAWGVQPLHIVKFTLALRYLPPMT